MNDHLQEPGGRVRLYVEDALAAGARIDPNDAQVHYLLHVMRAKVGDRVSLFNGRDGEWIAEIAEVTKRSCWFRCERQRRPQTPEPDIWLCFAPIKKAPADYLAQKATELGAAVLQPVMTRRTIVSRINLDRLRANAVEAAEQSERLTVPQVREPLTLGALLDSWPAGRRLLFCDEAGEAPALGRAVGKTEAAEWGILIGPEGGFDPAERDQVRRHPAAIPVALGPRILRADTAALASLALLQAYACDLK